MAGALKNSETKDKTSTGKRDVAGENLSDAEVLAILENALKRIRLRWGAANVLNVNHGDITTIIGLPKPICWCKTCGHFRVESDMLADGTGCQYDVKNSEEKP